MPDVNWLDALRIPVAILVALDNRDLHFAMQPWHYIIRLVHLLAIAGFFGAIAMVDLRLIGLGGAVPMRSLSGFVLPWVYGLFTITFVTGVGLFLYDPVHVGSHAWFGPKLLLTVCGLANALVFHRFWIGPALSASEPRSRAAQIAGILSLTIWAAVIVCASLNVESAPKVLLR